MRNENPVQLYVLASALVLINFHLRIKPLLKIYVINLDCFIGVYSLLYNLLDDCSIRVYGSFGTL